MALGHPLNVAAFVRSKETAGELRKVMTEMNGTRFDLQVGTLLDVEENGGAFVSSDILLLDVNPSDERDVELLSNIVNQRYPTTPVIVTAADATIHDVKQLMRLGIVDFLPQPITRADLIVALDLAAHRQRETQKSHAGDGKVVTFIKGGGGVGATTLAVQSGCALASQFKTGESQVCLLDLDFQFGTAALYLDLQCNVDYPDLVSAPERLDAALLAGVMTKHDSGLDVLGAPHEVMPLETLTPEFVDACLKVASERYKYIIIDLPEAWTEWSYRVLQESHAIILVTQLTVSGVRQARRQLDTLQMQGLLDDRVKLALNRFESGWGKTVRLKEAERALGRSIDFYVVNDYKTASESINQGVAFWRVKRRTKLEKCVRQMIQDVIEPAAGGVARQEPRLL